MHSYLPVTVQNEAKKVFTFGESERTTFIDGNIAEKSENPPIGTYDLEKKSTRWSLPAFKFSLLPKNSQLILEPAKPNLAKSMKRIPHASLKHIGGRMLKEREKEKENMEKRKKQEPVLDHRKYSNLVDWRNPKNILKIQSKGPKPLVYY